jgi:hypothetical protein
VSGGGVFVEVMTDKRLIYFEKGDRKFMTKNLLIIAIFCCLPMLCFPFALSAQTIVTGGFSGTITDPTGATLPGVTLTLPSTTTADTYSTVSSSTGGYVFSLLKPGDHTLTAKKEGFKTTTQKITVLLSQNPTVNFAMALGATAATVEVNAQATLLQTENANIVTTFDTHTVQNIRNPRNDVTYIAQTAPGVSMNTSSGNGFGNFSAFGLPGRDCRHPDQNRRTATQKSLSSKSNLGPGCRRFSAASC